MLKVKKAWLLKNLPMSVVVELENGEMKHFNKLLGNVTEEDLKPYKSYHPEKVRKIKKKDLLNCLYPVYGLEKQNNRV